MARRIIELKTENQVDNQNDNALVYKDAGSDIEDDIEMKSD